jgi:hypothetical protein
MNEQVRPPVAERFADRVRMEAAICRAAREAVLAHARAGNPVATWRDGQVVWVQPAEILARFGGETPSGAPDGERSAGA